MAPGSRYRPLAFGREISKKPDFTVSYPQMKVLLLASIGLATLNLSAIAFDTEKASTERFKVAYVEPKVTPPITDLPQYYRQRDQAIRDEQAQTKAGGDPKDILKMRQLYLRQALYPIRVTDKETGMVYEVQSDRRTIIATKPDGTIVWKVNPFVDAKLKPYRSDYPFIVEIWSQKPNVSTRKAPYLSIVFDGGQFGDLDLASGRYTYSGSD